MRGDWKATALYLAHSRRIENSQPRKELVAQTRDIMEEKIKPRILPVPSIRVVNSSINLSKLNNANLAFQ